MALKVEIDPRSGFCGGVIRAISRAEEVLDAEGELYSLGDIVHNEEELSRLEGRGLVPVKDISDVPAGHTFLIRAHGEPPSTYRKAAETGLGIIDCTCPVVLALQKSIREAYARLRESSGQLLIFGKVGHAEVLGLVGQVDGDAVVIEDGEMLSRLISDGTIRTGDVSAEIFSQTTKSPQEYAGICGRLKSLIPALVVHDTICSQVASRHEALSAFAASHDVVVFVSGRSSSNGRVLSELCLSANPRTHIVLSAGEISPGWFGPGDSVGVCGATSTPKWLLEEVAAAVENLAL